MTGYSAKYVARTAFNVGTVYWEYRKFFSGVFAYPGPINPAKPGFLHIRRISTPLDPLFAPDDFTWGWGQDEQIWVPFWAIVPTLAILPAIWLAVSPPPHLRHKPGLCQKCGYDLRATPERCPECGTLPGENQNK